MAQVAGGPCPAVDLDRLSGLIVHNELVNISNSLALLHSSVQSAAIIHRIKSGSIYPINTSFTFKKSEAILF